MLYKSPVDAGWDLTCRFWTIRRNWRPVKSLELQAEPSSHASLICSLKVFILASWRIRNPLNQRDRQAEVNITALTQRSSWSGPYWGLLSEGRSRHTTSGTCRTGSDGRLILVIDVWFVEDLPIRLNSPLEVDPWALTLDLWEKQERRACSEKAHAALYTTAAAKASGRFNTCLVQKGIAAFGIAEVEGGIGRRFQHHPPRGRDRCRMQAKEILPIKMYINWTFSIVPKSDLQTAHHCSRKRETAVHTLCPTRHGWQSRTARRAHRCWAECNASIWENCRSGLTTDSHLGTNRSKKRSWVHEGLPARPGSQSGSSPWPGLYRSYDSNFVPPSRSDWWGRHHRSHRL